MKISGTSTLTADRTTVFAALNDPAVLVAAIPGCQRLEALGGDAYKMTVAAGVGSIKGVYDGEVHLSEQQEPLSFRMKAQGAGAPGTIGAEVMVILEEGDGGSTILSYDADAVVGGMIGGVGQRMLTGVSKRMADEFFRNVDAVILAGGPGVRRPSPRQGQPPLRRCSPLAGPSPARSSRRRERSRQARPPGAASSWALRWGLRLRWWGRWWAAGSQGGDADPCLTSTSTARPGRWRPPSRRRRSPRGSCSSCT